MDSSVDQIEQREQEDPDDVDEVPVEAHDLDRSVILGSEVASPGAPDEPQEQPEADDHVERVESGHGEVEHHEELDAGGQSRIFRVNVGEVLARKEAMVDVLV